MLECCTGTLRPFQYLVATKTFEARKLGKTRCLSQRSLSVSYKRLKQASYMYLLSASVCILFADNFTMATVESSDLQSRRRDGRQCVSVIVQRGDRWSWVCHLDITLARVFMASAVLDYPFQHSCFLWVSRDHLLLSIHPAAVAAAAAVWTRCIGPHSFSYQVLDKSMEPSPCCCLSRYLCQSFPFSKSYTTSMTQSVWVGSH